MPDWNIARCRKCIGKWVCEATYDSSRCKTFGEALGKKLHGSDKNSDNKGQPDEPLLCNECGHPYVRAFLICGNNMCINSRASFNYKDFNPQKGKEEVKEIRKLKSAAPESPLCKRCNSGWIVYYFLLKEFQCLKCSLIWKSRDIKRLKKQHGNDTEFVLKKKT